MLGIEIGPNSDKCTTMNVIDKINRMQTRLNMWSQRGLTLFGKVLITKSMGISNLIYTLSTISVNDIHLVRAQKLIINNSFLKRNTIIYC